MTVDDNVPTTFNPDDYDWPNHLKTAIEALPLKNVLINRAMRYYEGNHPRVWITDNIRGQLDDQLITDMAENYCDLAVDAHVKRLAVTGFVNAENNSVFTKAANNIWDDNDLELAQKDLYIDARRAGEAFIFLWKDDDKEAGFDATIVDPRRVWWPDEAHRTSPSRVVQIWADKDEGVWRATCYYKFVVVRLIGPKIRNGQEALPQAKSFVIDPVDPGGRHGFESVPVVRFAQFKQRRSVIDLIRTIQDKINKLSANLLVSAEFNAWRKTIIMTEQSVDDDSLKFRPNRAIVLDPGGGEGNAAATSIWEGSATELSNYSNEIDTLIDKLFTKVHLPGHLKIASNKTLPSGAAYEADEGPFVEDIKDMQITFGESWNNFFDLCLGIDVDCQWRNPQVKSDTDEVTNVKTAVEAGVPLHLALKKYAGWTDEELKELESAPLSPKEQLSMAAASALANNGGIDNQNTNNGGE